MQNDSDVKVKVLKSNINTDLSIFAEVNLKNPGTDVALALNEAARMLTEQDELGFDVRPVNPKPQNWNNAEQTKVTAWFERFSKH